MPQKKKAEIGEFKSVFEGKLFTVKHADVILPSGKKEVWEMAFRKPSVMVLAIDDAKKILLIREYRERFGKYFIGLPAGRAEEGENPEAGALRELREETGFAAKEMTLFHFNDGGNSLAWPRYAYIARGLFKSPLPQDESEDITLLPTSLDDAYEMVKKDEVHNNDMAYMILRLYFDRKKFGL